MFCLRLSTGGDLLAPARCLSNTRDSQRTHFVEELVTPREVSFWQRGATAHGSEPRWLYKFTCKSPPSLSQGSLLPAHTLREAKRVFCLRLSTGGDLLAPARCLSNTRDSRRTHFVEELVTPREVSFWQRGATAHGSEPRWLYKFTCKSPPSLSQGSLLPAHTLGEAKRVFCLRLSTGGDLLAPARCLRNTRDSRRTHFVEELVTPREASFWQRGATAHGSEGCVLVAVLPKMTYSWQL